MKISVKNGKADKIHIYIDDEYRMTVDGTFWYSEKWHNLKEIDEEELAALENAVNSRRAFLSGMNLLSRRAHGKKELINKLALKHSREAAESAVQKLEELGLIDDEKFAEALADELLRRKKYAPRRIETELIMKGIDRQIAKDAVNSLDKDDFNRIILLLNSKYKNYLSDEKGIRRAQNGLFRMGYSYSDIRKALKEVTERTDEEDYYE